MSVQALALLAASSTLAGGLTLFGAASNVIILQNAEKKNETFSQAELLLAGSATVAASVAILLVWMAIVR